MESLASSGLVRALRWVTVLMIPFVSWGPAPWITGLFCLLVALLFLMRIRGETETEGTGIRITPLWAPFLMVAILGAVHLVASPVPYRSLLFIVHLTLAGILYLMLLETRSPDHGITVIVWTVSLVALVTFQLLAGGSGPPSGPFPNPNYGATALLTCLAWSLGSVMGGDLSRKQRRILLGLCLFSTAALAAIGSRSAGLAVLGLWLLFLVMGKGTVRFLGLAVLLLLLLAPSTLKQRVTVEYKEDPHAFSRTLIWQGALEMGLDHPALGVGPNLYYDHSPRYAFPTDRLPVRYGRIARKPHSEYLRAWAEGGAWGAVGVLAFLLITLRSAASAWRQGRYGPVLAVAAFLFQALFHDLNEVFALTALGAFWLACLFRDQATAVTIGGPWVRRTLKPAGAVVLLMALWLNLDVSARVLWMKGQRLTASGSPGGVKTLALAHSMNPLLPGVVRDLAAARLAAFRDKGDPKELELTRDAIRTAGRLNRLDTVPLRLNAALEVEQALRDPAQAESHLTEASRMLSKALELEPHNALIMINLSGIYWDLGRRQEAMETVHWALEEEPNYLEAHRKRVAYLNRWEPALVNEAERALERARERSAGYTPRSTYEEIILK